MADDIREDGSTRPSRDGQGSNRSLLTLHEAAERLNVHYMTAYRWVRAGELPAFKAGGRIRVRAEDVDAYLTARRVNVDTAVAASGRTDWDLHLDRLVDQLLAGDGGAARHEVTKVVSDGATAGEAYLRLLTPALHRIGDAWARGDINVAVEHRAHQICAGIVAQLGERFRRRGPNRGTAVTLTPSGERHALGAAMVADFLRGAGYAVHHLGGDVPTADLTMFLKVMPADLVCFSITQPARPDTYAELVDAVRAIDPDTTVVFGGQGVDDETATAAGGTTIHDLADLAEQLAGA